MFYRSPNPDLSLEIPLELVPSFAYKASKPENITNEITFTDLKMDDGIRIPKGDQKVEECQHLMFGM